VLQKLNFAISCASEDIYEILGAVLSFLRDSQLSHRDETSTKHNQKSPLSEKCCLKKIDRLVFELTENKQTNRLTQNDISRQQLSKNAPHFTPTTSPIPLIRYNPLTFNSGHDTYSAPRSSRYCTPPRAGSK
jgi:hypothetical protein